jgi:hypothetical protein
MNVTKLKQHRRIKRYDKQQWKKQAFKEALEAIDEKNGRSYGYAAGQEGKGIAATFESHPGLS